MQKYNRDWALPLPGDCCLFHVLATYNTATDVVKVIFLPFPYCRRVDLFPPRKFKIPTTAVLWAGLRTATLHVVVCLERYSIRVWCICTPQHRPVINSTLNSTYCRKLMPVPVPTVSWCVLYYRNGRYLVPVLRTQIQMHYKLMILLLNCLIFYQSI
jgi:hypothetical protein